MKRNYDRRLPEDLLRSPSVLLPPLSLLSLSLSSLLSLSGGLAQALVFVLDQFKAEGEGKAVLPRSSPVAGEPFSFS